MTYDERQIRQGGSASAVAGIVGIAIGAAVGSAATAILSDQQKRTRVVGALKGMKKKAMDAAGTMRSGQPAKKLEEQTETPKKTKSTQDR